MHMSKTIPSRFVAKSGPKNRVGKIFIDYLRNDQEATTICAWSLRARKGLGISVPVDWSELKTLKSSDHWTLRNVHTRLDVGNAAWETYEKSAVDITDAISALKVES
jgi:bifunctional non-homologous end joining protein LigD